MKRLLTVALLTLAPLSAHAFTLAWPVACTLGKDCFIQNFADHEAGPTYKDFTCNAATYDTHNGTDIRLRNLAAMRAGVNVLAAEEGMVQGTRDGVEDTGIKGRADKARVAGVECGNGVRIGHLNGYATQYCHMRKGSIRVKKGDMVKAGQVIGQVGLSGATEFPHLHISVWKAKTILDPFTGGAFSEPCNSAGTEPLWPKPATTSITAVMGDGFVSVVPTKERMRDTPESHDTLPSDGANMLYWADLINVRKGDMLTLSITGPDGKVWAEKSETMEKPLAGRFSYLGRSSKGDPFAPGSYRAKLTLTRGGETILEKELGVSVR